MQNNQHEYEERVHFGYLANARVPYFHELLLTIRMSHKLEDN